jgi:hypothetical protein
VKVSDSIFLDTVRPVPRALRATTVARRGRRVALRYRVEDAEPCGPTSTVIVTLRTLSGRALRTFVRQRVPVNEPQALGFTCRLPRGTYRWVVRARDTAGNPEPAPAKGMLVVR